MMGMLLLLCPFVRTVSGSRESNSLFLKSFCAQLMRDLLAMSISSGVGLPVYLPFFLGGGLGLLKFFHLVTAEITVAKDLTAG